MFSGFYPYLICFSFLHFYRITSAIVWVNLDFNTFVITHIHFCFLQKQCGLFVHACVVEALVRLIRIKLRLSMWNIILIGSLRHAHQEKFIKTTWSEINSEDTSRDNFTPPTYIKLWQATSYWSGQLASWVHRNIATSQL